MKKLILSLGFGCLLSTSFAQAQVIVNVEAPEAISGPVISFVAATTWSAQLTDPANAVTDTVVIANDSLACNPITNNLTGKIAMIYRGSCSFSSKAFAAQNAGAVAVIIVNNVAGPAAGMLGGTEVITIPVVMVSQADGAAIREQIQLGENVVVYMGIQAGYYTNDLGFRARDIRRANGGGVLSLVAQSGTEFDVDLGAFVHNYGTAAQTGVTLNAKVLLGAAELYNETSAPFDVTPGSSTYASLPAFSEATYANGEYSTVYTINGPVEDGYTADNSITSTFIINDSVFSLTPLNAAGVPAPTGGIQPAPFSGQGFTSCIVFLNENADRLLALGMYFSMYTNTPAVLTGSEVGISVSQWTDEFTDVNDQNYDYTTIDELATGSFGYTSDDQGVVKYASFEEPVILENNIRYLFCVTTYENSIFHGYNNDISYVSNIEYDLQPLYPILNGTAYSFGFTSETPPAHGVRMTSSANIGINENVIETAIFPNPAKDVVTVKVDATGTAFLNVTDLAGRSVLAREITIENGQFVTTVADFQAGTYIFTLAYADGTNSQFKVIVAK